MRKFLYTLLLLAPMAVVATTVLTVSDLNQVFTDILKPYQNAETKMGVNFSDLEFHPDGVRRLKVDAFMWVKGATTEVDLRVTEAQFINDLKSSPTLNFEGSANLDLVAAFGKETLTELGETLDEMALDFVSEQSQEYGNAVDADAKTYGKQYDKDGNLTHINMDLMATIDLTKLPVDVKENEVLFTNATVKLQADVQGVSLALAVEINPTYKGFAKDQEGLKQHLEKLINRDADEMDSVNEAVAFVLSIAKDIGDAQP